MCLVMIRSFDMCSWWLTICMMGGRVVGLGGVGERSIIGIALVIWMVNRVSSSFSLLSMYSGHVSSREFLWKRCGTPLPGSGAEEGGVSVPIPSGAFSPL